MGTNPRFDVSDVNVAVGDFMQIMKTSGLMLSALAATSTVQAQSSLNDAHAVVNRLVESAGGSVMYSDGRPIDGAYSQYSNVRTASACKTAYSLRYPSSEAIQSDARGTRVNGDFDWQEISSIEPQGARVYYNAVGSISGKVRRFHLLFGSPSQAQAFAEAANRLSAACKGQDDDKVRADDHIIDPKGQVASLAIDRRNGTRFGWAIDYDNIDAADRRSMTECGRDGSRCQVVLRFTGGCGAYAADTARGSTAYGWGTATTRAGAESRAAAEARTRGATNVVTRVWGCNSVKPGAASAASSGPSPAQQARAERERQFQEKLRLHDEAVRAHDAAVKKYGQQVEANQTALQNASERRKAAQGNHEAELAKARAAKEKYEREQQAYREEYKRVTGKYPGE